MLDADTKEGMMMPVGSCRGAAGACVQGALELAPSCARAGEERAVSGVSPQSHVSSHQGSRE